MSKHIPSEPSELNALRARILRFYLSEAQQTGPLIDQVELRQYDRRWLRKLIQALALAGLLDKFGGTRGTHYLTSRLGFIVLAALRDEDSAAKKKPPSKPGV
jgi:hypothetical protein